MIRVSHKLRHRSSLFDFGLLHVFTHWAEGPTQTKGKPTHPHNSEKAGIEEEDDEYAGPSSLQYDVFHDGGRGE